MKKIFYITFALIITAVSLFLFLLVLGVFVPRQWCVPIPILISTILFEFTYKNSRSEGLRHWLMIPIIAINLASFLVNPVLAWISFLFIFFLLSPDIRRLIEKIKNGLSYFWYRLKRRNYMAM
jgi:hypothetical protein